MAARAKEISGGTFLAVTIFQPLEEYPAPFRTAWLDLAANCLYIPIIFADLEILYHEAKKLSALGQPLPIIEHGSDRFVAVTWLRQIEPRRAALFAFLEKSFRDGLYPPGSGKSN